MVLLELGWPELAIAFVCRLAGQQVAYFKQRTGGSQLRDVLRKLGIELIALESAKSVNMSEHSSGISAMAALRCIDKWTLDFPDSLDQLQRVDRAFMHDALRAALLRRFAEQSVDVFKLDAWVRGSRHRPIIVVVRSAWTRALLQEAGILVRILRLPLVESLGSGRRVCGLAIRNLFKWLASTVHHSSFPNPGDLTSSEAPLPAHMPSILLVFNRGLDYGPLYSYRFLLSSEIDSPLYKSHVGGLTIQGGDFAQEFQVQPLPPGGDLAKRFGRWLLLYRGLRKSSRGKCPAFVSSWMAGLLARSEFQAKYLQRTFPRVSIAVLAYDIQIPSSLTIAFHLAGIRSVAVHERPASAFDMSSSLIVDTLLTASPFFSARALASPSVAVRRVTAVGMWRTDLLNEAKYLQPPPDFQRAQSERKKIVLALPYHLLYSGDQASHPVVSSAESLRHFLEGIIGVASRRPDTYVVIRGKNCDWLSDRRFGDLVAQIARQPNLKVDTDYTTVNKSYNLALHASLIIAKPTSLADEALAYGIPCLLHDYTHNSQGFAVNNLSYLPRELWCLNDSELTTKVDAFLDEREAFDQWWGPIGAATYGALSDGNVRRRIREIIEHEEASMPK